MKSMTGFGKCEISRADKTISVEIKSVNNRFLDLSIKMPRMLSQFEDNVRKVVQSNIARGRVDVFISFSDLSEKSKTVVIDNVLASNLVRIAKDISEKYQLQNDFSVSRLIRTPDVISIKSNDIDDEAVSAILFDALNIAITKFNEMRQNEGELLKRDISNRISKIRTTSDNLKVIAPIVIKEHRDKLSIRIKELLGDVDYDESKMLNEVAFFTDKCNIDEETTRLIIHIKHMSSIIATNEPIGRKLDFLVQELNREANTVCSKANNSEITKIGVDLKCEIEKIREQVQNIE